MEFFYFKREQFKNINNSYKLDFLYFIVAVIGILYILYPYWAFGRFSYAGWYDETYLQIPVAYLKYIFGYQQGYSSSYAGGVDLGTMVVSPIISMQNILLKLFPFWVANFIYRFSAFLVMYSASYFLLKRNFFLTSFLSFSLSLFLCSGWLFEGWILGGLGWMYPAILLMLIGFFYNFSTLKFRLLYVTLVSCLISSTTGPIYLLPNLGFLFMFIIIFYDPCRIKNKQVFYKYVYTWAILLCVLLCNWFSGIMKFLHMATASSRTLQITSLLFSVGELPRLVSDNLLAIVGIMERGTFPSILYVGVATILLVLSLRSFSLAKRLFLQLVFLIFTPIALQCFFSVFHISATLASFKWLSITDVYPVAFIILLAGFVRVAQDFLSSNKNAEIKNKIFITVSYLKLLPLIPITLFFMNINVLFFTNFGDLNNYSGIGATSIYTNLNKLNFENGKNRFLSIGHLFPMLPIYYDLDNFSGTSDGFSMRRYYYTQHMCKAGYACELNNTHQVFLCAHNSCPKFPLGFNLALLKMVNIKYISNNEKIDNTNFKFVSSHSGVSANDISYFGKAFLRKRFDKISLVKPLYVYKFKEGVWPRVFNAIAIKNSKFSYKNDKFYSQLSKLEVKKVLIARNDSLKKIKLKINDKMKVLNYKFSKNGVNIDTNARGGVLVFNQGISPYWQASCSGKLLSIVPVNGLMMAVQAPKDCPDVHFNLLANRRG